MNPNRKTRIRIASACALFVAPVAVLTALVLGTAFFNEHAATAQPAASTTGARPSPPR